uniref:Uncharacterized protein n=2 Tax=Micrurus TaxID=8634 RepID=A0A2D4HYD7_MICLE
MSTIFLSESQLNCQYTVISNIIAVLTVNSVFLLTFDRYSLCGDAFTSSSRITQLCMKDLMELLKLTCSHFFPQDSVVSERDYESLVMMRMRQASERQKLIEKMKQEDEEEACT